MIGLIVATGLETLRNRHTYAVGKTLPERTSGCFNTRCMAVFRMPWRFAAPLWELFEIIEREIITSEVEHTVLKHGSVARREDKTVTIQPMWITRIVTHQTRPEQIGKRCKSHSCTWMTRIGFLNSIH